MKEELQIEVLKKLVKIVENLGKETFSLNEASDFLKTTPETVKYYSQRQKQLAHVNLGGTLIFRRKDLDEFLEKKLKKPYVF